jgi:hypothetical protein
VLPSAGTAVVAKVAATARARSPRDQIKPGRIIIEGVTRADRISARRGSDPHPSAIKKAWVGRSGFAAEEAAAVAAVCGPLRAAKCGVGRACSPRIA